MLTITGEVRKFIESDYLNKKKEKVAQAILVLEPETGRQNYEITFSSNQLTEELKNTYNKLKGKIIRLPVSLFVSYEYRFYKYNAVGDGLPSLKTN